MGEYVKLQRNIISLKISKKSYFLPLPDTRSLALTITQC